MTQEELLGLLAETGSYKQGHFLLTSGRHSDQFFLMSQSLQYPAALERIGKAIAAQWQGQGIQTVVGPAVGGILLAYEVACELGVRSIFAEKVEGGMALKRGFTLAEGEQVLVVEDAVTTGGSVFKTLEALKPFRPALVGVAMVVDRSQGQVDFGVRTTKLATVDVTSWTPEECPLCKAGDQVVSLKR